MALNKRLKDLGGLEKFKMIFQDDYDTRCLCGKLIKRSVTRLAHVDTHKEIYIGKDCWDRLSGIEKLKVDTGDFSQWKDWVCDQCDGNYYSCSCINYSCCGCCGYVVESKYYHNSPDTLEKCEKCCGGAIKHWMADYYCRCCRTPVDDKIADLCHVCLPVVGEKYLRFDLPHHIVDDVNGHYYYFEHLQDKELVFD